MTMRDLHVHTSFCDGANTPEEMAEAAYALGLSTLGFSGHSFVPFDTSCMTRSGTEEYKARVRALAERYRGKMQILCGVEQDIFSPASTAGYDFVIGSVHYLRRGEEYRAVDDTPEALEELTADWFGGDWYAVMEAYFQTVSRVVEETHADIIGHFDMISKFNEKRRFFDETHPRYRAAWQIAAKKLLETGKPFEINTGAMSRGWKSVPYPSPEICGWLRDRGARFLLSSDSHRKETLCWRFGDAAQLLCESGRPSCNPFPGVV